MAMSTPIQVKRRSCPAEKCKSISQGFFLYSEVLQIGLFQSIIVPEHERSARALARIKVMLSLPYNWQRACDLEWFPLVTRRVARRDRVCMASAPQHSYVSTAMGKHDQPSSKHLAFGIIRILLQKLLGFFLALLKVLFLLLVQPLKL